MTSPPAPARCGPGSSAEMGTAPGVQALRLLLALLLGLGTGLVYDLLRPLRRRGGRALGAGLDLLFAVLSGLAAFLFAMGSLSGRLGQWELAAMLAGFLLYLHLLSPALLPAMADLWRGIMALCKKVRKNMEEA